MSLQVCVGGREGQRTKGRERERWQREKRRPRCLAAASLSFGVPRSASGQKNGFSQYFTFVMLLPPTPATAEFWQFCTLTPRGDRCCVRSLDRKKLFAPAIPLAVRC